MKNLLPTRKDLPVTRILQDLLDVTSSSTEMDEYLYLDPKLSKSSLSKIDKSKMFFNDAIVFMIGGGNYLEYQNLMDCSSVRFINIKIIAVSWAEKKYCLWIHRISNSIGFFESVGTLRKRPVIIIRGHQMIKNENII